MKVICCVCGKVKNNNLQTKPLSKNNKLVSHGYCTTCRDNFIAQLNKIQKSA